MLVRDFQRGDIDSIVEILQLNDQYGCPEVDGSARATVNQKILQLT